MPETRAHGPVVPALGASEHWLAPQEHAFGTRAQLIHIDGELTGRFPVVLNRWRYGFPVTLLQSWTTPLTFVGTPYIREDAVEVTLEAFLMQEGQSAFLLNAVPASGPFWDRLAKVTARLEAPHIVLEDWHRAALNAIGTFEQWFENNFERKRRKEFRRLRARLAETGNLQCQRLAPGDSLETWIGELSTLEAKGWKGRKGSALAARPEVVKCLLECLHRLRRDGNLRFWKLSLDGRPIAMMFAMVEGRQAWLGKIAYDEEFARYSPGVLLVLDATEDFFADPGIDCVDSCAIPGHPMIDHLWRDRLHFCNVLIGRPGIPHAAFAALGMAERLRSAARGKLRNMYYRWNKRHRS